MKILFISNDPAILDAASPARARMRAYAGALASPRFGGGELHVVSVAPSGARETREGPLFLYPVRAPRLLRVRALARAARAVIRARGIEVVSAQDPFEEGLAALRAVRGTNARLHIQIHTDFLSPWFVREGNWRSPLVRMPLLNRYRRRIADRVLPAAAGIRTVSERVKASLRARYGSAIPEPSVIPVAVPADAPEPVALPPHDFTFALIAVGRLEPEKRIEDILAALKLVVAHYPMAGLFIVGEGRERRYLERMARALGLGKNVVFLGARPDARGLMARAQAFIQASAYEGYGRSLVEAALAKVPIVTTDVGIVGDVFRGYEDVLSAPVADPTALSLNIVGLIEDTSVRLQLPIRAEAKARAHLAAAGDLTLRVVEDLVRLV